LPAGRAHLARVFQNTGKMPVNRTQVRSRLAAAIVFVINAA